MLNNVTEVVVTHESVLPHALVTLISLCNANVPKPLESSVADDIYGGNIGKYVLSDLDSLQYI